MLDGSLLLFNFSLLFVMPIFLALKLVSYKRACSQTKEAADGSAGIPERPLCRGRALVVTSISANALF